MLLAATNTPFDQAVIRRLPHRLMVNLPDAPNNAKILKMILAKEDLAHDVDLDSVACMTNGYSKSNLNINILSQVFFCEYHFWNLCIADAYQPVGEIFVGCLTELENNMLAKEKDSLVHEVSTSFGARCIEGLSFLSGMICMEKGSRKKQSLKYIM
uniref:ATPase AAA-type core domain-containing protein n=1 Tax=Solanum lycopersicum TaxID=4081 RepID=A0A3Q7GZ62_SOLLC